MLGVLLFLIAWWVSDAARRSPHPLPEFAAPCVVGWWALGKAAIEIGDGTTRAACLSVPKDAIVSQQGTRWTELDLAHFHEDAGCVARLPSPRIRVEQWYAAKTPQPSATKPAWGSGFPDYLRFPPGPDASGTEMFVPRDTSSGLRTIGCVIGTDACWAAARDDLLLVKWSTPRGRLATGLAQDWACMRGIVKAARVD